MALLSRLLVPPDRRPLLHFGYLDDCPACAQAKPVIATIEREAGTTLRVRRVNVAAGGKLPVPVTYVPAVVLELPGFPGVWEAARPGIAQDLGALRTWLAAGMRRLAAQGRRE